MITRVIATALFVAAAFCSSASAHDYKAGSLFIHHPWSRATPPGASVGGGYFSIRNDGTAPDRLVGASLEGAAKGEVHEMTTVDGVMKMRPVDGGLDIPPGGTVELKPGGFHVMFVGLKSPLKQGERVKGTLVFEKAGTVPVEFVIDAIGAKGEEHMDHSGHTQ
jgi:copper(I)-binding protein